MQIGFYDGSQEFVNSKPIRLIELFGGIGCQAKASGISNSQLYKQAGNGIVVNVLMSIFGQMLDNFDFNEYIEEFYKEIGE